MPLPKLAEPTAFLPRQLGRIYGLIALVLLLSSLLFVNFLQTLSLLLKPLFPRLFRRANRELANSWWTLCDLYAQHVYGIEVVFSGCDLPMRENALVLCNHQEMADITVLFRLARQKGRLGDMKWFVKDVLKYAPGVGWGMLFLDCLFIKRDWLKDKHKIEKTFATLLAYKVPVWLVSFVEGTRMKPSSLASSQRYAAASGLTPLKHVLVPRSKGFVATVEGLGSHLDAVYDITIGYVDGVPTLWQWAEGRVRKVHVHVRRYALADLPQGSEALGAWLHARYVEKDALLDAYYAQGAFSPHPESSRT